ncbi:MAG: TAXI family TRAP transporter solute-binding subunit, partial [Synergistaceae bacterium]|nr:TAXI family TRAP transporter solute-binding subunit [Synergistaceae bacterium]
AAPGSAIMEIAAVRDIVLISLPEDVIDKVCKQHQFLLNYTIEKGTYSKQDQPCRTVADANFLVVNEKMTEKVAYDCLKTFIDKKEEMMKVTPHAANFVPKKASLGIIPFHPGAVKYFKEQGITVK